MLVLSQFRLDDLIEDIRQLAAERGENFSSLAKDFECSRSIFYTRNYRKNQLTLQPATEKTLREISFYLGINFEEYYIY